MARPRFRKVLAALALGVVVAGAGGEVLLRELLFGDSTWARENGARFRRPRHFADSKADADYWKLQYLFQPADARRDLRSHHPELGWTSQLFSGDTFEHVDEPRINGRRPVLLFGDSFARCALPHDGCWQMQLERTQDLSQEFCILNYGVRGYGLDQTLLLLRRVLPRWLERSPVVIFSLLVDDDIDRCALRFRNAPKPVLELDGETLRTLEPGAEGTRAWVRENPPDVTSYLWRYLTHARVTLPKFLRAPRQDDADIVEHKRVLARAIFAEVDKLAEETGVELFVLLFHGERTLPLAPGADWREAIVLEVCTELELPFVSSRTAILEHAARKGFELSDYFLEPEKVGALAGHYDHQGRRAAFPALRRGLRGQFE